MKRSLLAITCSAMLVACATAPTPSGALEKPNILIMGEDADQDTVPRNSRVFRRVLDALVNELNNEGFDVFDETAVTLDDMAQGRTRRTDAEIIDVARTVKRPPISVVVMFSIYASANETSYTTKIKTRVAGRLLTVHSGQRLGNFEVVSPKTWNGPKDCPRECILEVVGKYSKIIAQDVGSVLAEKLSDAAGGGATTKSRAKVGNGYTLVFDGFTPEDIMDAEEYLVVFRGYRSHRLMYGGNRHHEIWYVSDITSARLDRNLKKMLDRLGIRGRVTFSGNEYTVQKIARRRQRPINKDDW